LWGAETIGLLKQEKRRIQEGNKNNNNREQNKKEEEGGAERVARANKEKQSVICNQKVKTITP